MGSEGSTLPSRSLSQGLALGLGPRLSGLPGEVEVTSAFLPHVQRLLLLFVASEDDDQFLPGLVLHHPHHALQTGAAREALLLGERLGVGWGRPRTWSCAQDAVFSLRPVLGVTGPKCPYFSSGLE